MGTTLSLSVSAPQRTAALQASEAALRAVETTERRLSTWRDDSELACLNRAPVGSPVEVSAALSHDLGAALRWSRATGGAFNPGVGRLVRVWGLRSGGREPQPREILQARHGARLEGVRVAGLTVTRLAAGFVFEEGGFGKGAALDAAAEALAAVQGASGVLNLGGQVRLAGAAPLEILIAHPAERARAVLALELADGSVATSGDGERTFEAGGAAIGHLLDPRTGEPAPDFGSMTVWAPSALAADCLSTALFVMGPEAGVRWAARRPGIEAVALMPLPDGRVAALASAGLATRLEVLDGSTDLRFVPAARGRPGSPTTPARR